jgi:signal transduction histidine kinase
MKATDYDQAEWLLLTNQSVRDMEIMFRNKKGEQRLGLISTENIVVDGRSCILGILVDITEQRKMEIEMTRLDRLNLVGEMSASIGHEIRNPMTTVRGYLQLLREREDYQPDKDYFDLMIEELDRANSIITEFLSLAKNKMVDMTRQNLNAIISKSLPLIEASALSRNQYIYHELNDLPDLLLDKEEIHQLILNMLKNGLESMSSTGAVTIKTLVENENALLVIEDQGSGIDRAVLDKLGTPFFTTKENGTGLGLAVCYRIAARHNATIDVKTSSKGTAFFIRFPIPQ